MAMKYFHISRSPPTHTHTHSPDLLWFFHPPPPLHIIGASLSEPHTYEFAVCPPTLPVWIYMYICIYIYIYVCILYLGQQFGQRFRCLARSFVSLKDQNTFKDVWDVRRKTWMPFSRRAMRLFVHVDVSFD